MASVTLMVTGRLAIETSVLGAVPCVLASSNGTQAPAKHSPDILASMTAAAEGVTTARSIHDLARQKRIDMPITHEVFGVLFESKFPAAATESLMQRPPRGE